MKIKSPIFISHIPYWYLIEAQYLTNASYIIAISSVVFMLTSSTADKSFLWKAASFFYFLRAVFSGFLLRRHCSEITQKKL